jgi:preprotein translocase subunit SecD
VAHQYLAYAFTAAALLLGGWGYTNRARRTALWAAALAAVCAAASAYGDSFWSAVVFGTLALWGTIGGLNIADNSWRMRGGLIASVFIIGLVTLWPTLSAMSGGKIPLPELVKDRVAFKLVAGLDLRGGLRLVYTVDVAEAIRDRRDRRYENMRVELAKIFDLHEGDEVPDEKVYVQLREKVDLQPSPTESNVISLKLKDGVDVAKVDAKFLDQFSGDLGFSRSDDQRQYTFRLKEDSESELRQTAVAQAKEIILRRVDELGLREASVSTRDEDIIVEVPGQDESTFNEIREIISQTASLEFKLLDDDTDFFGAMQRDQDLQLPEGISLQAETVSVGEDADGDIQKKQTSYAHIEAKKDEALKATLARFKQWTATLQMPPDRELGFELVRSIDPDTNVESETGWRTYLLKSRAEITGDMIRDAQAVPDTGTSSLGGWYVSLNFTDAGGSIFERITGANIKRRFAIILDERIESAPVIQGRIPGGRASITMGSGDPAQQLADSRKLEMVLRSGALPAPITPSNEQHIGPSLGEASINLAVKGALFSSIIVLAFMYLYYRGAGIIANLAVLFNLLMQMAVLATFNASMTLPGIAGLALTIGMGVDANVLINERIREEIREGKSARAAVEIGFNRAFSAIVDGHVTTLISAIVLAQFGTGPIKGFAVTLMVGVTTSIFTGVVVSRWLFDFWIRNMDRNAKLNMG